MSTLKSNVLITNENPKESSKKKSKNSIYQIVRMKIFFVKNKNRNSKSSKSLKSAKLTSENQMKNGIKKTSLEFVFTVTDFDEEQVIKAKSYIESSKYSEALSILEPISSNRSIKSDYDILFWIGHCHEYLKNYQLADKYYKVCADYLYDDGYWEATYGKFLLKNSLNLNHNIINNNNNNNNNDDDKNNDGNHDEKVEEGIKRLLSAANKKKYVSAMYILGKIYINGLYNINQDFRKGEFYLRRAYNGGEKGRSWSAYEKKAIELVKNGQLSKVPEEHVWAKDHKALAE